MPNPTNNNGPTVDGTKKANQGYLGQQDNPYYRWLAEQQAEVEAQKAGEVDIDPLAWLTQAGENAGVVTKKTQEDEQPPIPYANATTPTPKPAEEQPPKEAVGEQPQLTDELQGRYDYLASQRDVNIAAGHTETADALQKQMDALSAEYPTIVTGQEPQAVEPQQPLTPKEQAQAQQVSKNHEKDIAAINAKAAIFDAYTSGMVADTKERMENTRKAMAAGGNTVALTSPLMPTQQRYTNITGNVYPAKFLADMDNANAKEILKGQAEATKEREQLEMQLPQWREQLADKQKELETIERPSSSASYLDEAPMIEGEIAQLQQQIEGAEARLASIDEGLATGIDPSLDGMIKRQQQMVDSLQKKLEEAKENAQDRYLAMVSETADGILGKSALYSNLSSAIITDPTVRMYQMALDSGNRTLQEMEDQKERNSGGDVGFLSGFGRKALDLRTYDFGIGDLLDNMMKLGIANGDFQTPEQIAAAEAVVYEAYKEQEVGTMFGGNHSLRQSAGEMTAQMIPFMFQFFIGGGETALSRGAISIGTRVGEQMVGKEVATAIERGAIRYLTEGGMRAFWRELGYYVPRNLGVAVSDVIRTVPIMGLQSAEIAAQTIENKLGQVEEGGDGQLRFENNQPWSRSLYQAAMDMFSEDISETFGTHIGWIFTGETAGKLANAMGAKAISQALTRGDMAVLGDIARQTRRSFLRFGINGLPEEITEEYYGQALKTLLNLDTAYYYDDNGERKNLFTSGRWNAELWSGMAMSMGAMDVFYKGINYYQYRNVTKGLRNANAVAEEYLGNERWQQLRRQIDDTPNDDIGSFVQNLWLTSGLSQDQLTAATNYAGELLVLRGTNLASLRMAAAQTQTEEDINNATVMAQQKGNANYALGYATEDAGTRNGINNLLLYTQQRLNETLGTAEDGTVRGNAVREALNAALYDPAAIEQIIADHPEWGEKEIQAVRDYVDSKQMYDGMVQAVRDNIDIEIARQKAAIDTNTNKTTGNVQGATMKDDSKVYVIDGVVTPFDDRTGIDSERSDQSVVVKDQNTGEVKMVAASDILMTDDQEYSPDDLKQQVEENLRASMSEDAASQINGTVDFSEGNTFMVTVNGQNAQVTITPNEEGVVDNGDGTVNVSDGETVFPMSKTLIQQQVRAQGLYNAAQAIGWRNAEGEEEEEVAATTPETPDKFELNKQIRLRDQDGNEAVGTILSRADLQNNYEYQVEIGGRVYTYTPEELEAAYIGDVEQQAVATDVVAETAENEASGQEAQEGNNEASETDEMGAEQAGEDATTAAVNEALEQSSQEPQSALEQIPVDEQGNPIYEQSTPATAWDALVEQTEGDENEAQAVADDMVKDKEEALKQAQAEQKKPTQGATPAEKIAERKARADAVAQAQSDLDFWNAVAAEQQRRAEAQQQAAPTEQTTNEQPATEQEATPAEETPQQQEQSRESAEETTNNGEVSTNQEQEQRQAEAQRIRQQAEQQRMQQLQQFAENLQQWVDGMNLNTPVRIVATEQELQELASQMDEQRHQQGRTSHFREQVDRAIREGRVVNAFMSPTTGEVVVYAPSIWNGASGVGTVEQRMAQAMERGQQVVAHEVLAHKGLRQLLGDEAFKELCEQIYKGMSKYARAKYARYHWDNNLSEETKKRLVGEDLASKSWDALTPIEKAQIWASPEMATELRQGAADEYAAHLAEKVIGNETLTPKEQSVWEKILSAIRKLFGQMDDTAIADALVQARDNLRQGEEAEAQIIGEQEARTDEENQQFSAEEQERVLSNVQGQKQVGVEYDFTPSQMQEMDSLNDEVRFSSKEDRLNRLGGMIRNMRPDMSEEQQQSLLNYVEGLRKEDNGPTLEIATLKWYLMGKIRIPEDMQEVRRVVAIGKKAGADVTDIKRFPNPESVVDEFPQVEMKDPPMNPDEVETLTNKKTYPNGITVYDVENSEDGRQNMRYIIDTHLGKDHNPWCLLGGNGNGELNAKSRGYWYDDYPRFGKKVAFKNGKLIAFFAAGPKDKGPTWWDLQDHPTSGIPVDGEIPNDPLGRSATYEYNIPIEEIEESNDYTQDWGDEAVRLDEIDDRRNEIDERLEEIDSLIDKIESHRAMVKAIAYTIDRQLERLDDSEGTEQEKEAERARLEEERANLQAETDEYDALVDEKRDLESERNDLDDESYELEQAVNKGTSSESWRSEYKEGINSPTEIHKGNRKNGDYTEWWSLHANHIKEEAHYKDGKLVGEYRSYHKDGRPDVTCTRNENGRLDGKYTKRASNGQILRYANYDNGDRIGPEIKYWDNGQLNSFFQFGKNEHGDEVVDGIKAIFTYDGKLTSFGRESNGHSVGEMCEWYNDGGAERYTVHTETGDSWKQARWTYRSENLTSYIKYDGSNDSYQEIKFSKEGQLEKIYNSKNDKQNGPQIEVWYDGTHRFALYDNGELVGQAVYWNPQEAGATYGDETIAPLSAREAGEAFIKETDIDGIKREGEEMLERANQLRRDAAHEALEAAKETLKAEGEEGVSVDEDNAIPRFSVEDMSEAQLDRAYFDAMEVGDEARMREVLNEVAQRRGYDANEDWRYYHGAPEATDDVQDDDGTLYSWTLADEANNNPHRANHISNSYYSSVNINGSRDESMRAIQNAISAIRRGDDPMVTIYRAVPRKVKEGKVRRGDWVTMSRAYAVNHGQHVLGYNNYRIIEEQVPASQLYWDGNDINEWGFDDGKEYRYRNTKNNRKLDDLVTRDDNGNVIPPSKRFNNRNEDLRFSTDEEIAQANERFNEELQQQIDGTQEAGHAYQLGMPNKILRAAGFPYLPIELTATQLANKAKQHNFDISDMKGLVEAINNPVAIFKYGDEKKAQNVIVEIERDGKNFVVGIHFYSNGAAINSIRGLNNKNTPEWLNWITQNKLLWIDKEKIQPLIFKQQTNPADVKYLDLDSVAKIIQDFENPKFGEEKNTGNGEFNTPQGEARFSAEEQERQDIIEKARQDGTLGKAPNGAESNLMRQGGEQLWATVRTPAFKNWFGDWENDAENSSKVVDENGEPKVVYHGSYQWFTQFNNGDVSQYSHSNAPRGTIFTTDNREVANSYVAGNWYGESDGQMPPVAHDVYLDENDPRHREYYWGTRREGGIYPLFMNMRNPLVVDFDGNLWREAPIEGKDINDVVAEEMSNGEHDGVIAMNVKDVGPTDLSVEEIPASNDYIAFNPNQVKSIDNNGNFSNVDNDIRFSTEGRQQEEAPQNEDLFARAERIAQQYQRQREQQREEAMRFRVKYDQDSARDAYEHAVQSGLFQSVEALQDSQRSVFVAMKSILGQKRLHIEDVPDFMNAYTGENRLSSVNQAEMEIAARQLFTPLLREVARLAPTQQEHDTLVDYMMAKHGLERNRYMAEREAQKQFAEYQAKNPNGTKTLADFINEARQKDYAGLTALTGQDNVYDAELLAEQMVADYEAMHDTNRLWRRVRAVSNAVLSKQYESGFLTRADYDRIRGMYQYYIPLRGFDEKTADEEYAYLTARRADNVLFPTAKGRKSKADDPFANLRKMMENAISSGNRNTLVKQRFMNFVMNHPSDLVGVSDMWLWYDDNKQEWVPQFPDINDGDTPAQIQQKCEQFEQDMQAKAAANPDRYVKQSDRPDIPYRITSKGQLREHQVIVARGGRDYVLTVNGSPRLAQALNGLTNPDSRDWGKMAKTIDAANSINRFLSAAYTTRNPDFIISNFFRDMLYSNSMVWVKEKGAYAAHYNLNYAKTNPVMMNILLTKFRRNTLDMNNEMERMFYEFMAGGGETGYASIRDIDAHKNEIQRELNKYAGRVPIRKAFDYLGERFDELNRSVELCARFAAFVTSREFGRTIGRSVYDAKEISVNFNKKGSGGTFIGATGQTRLGNLASRISLFGRTFYVFWNAAMQGTTNFGRQFGRHPAKALTAAATLYALGSLVSYLGNMGGDDDDNDSGAYWNLPEYVRRANIMFRAGKDYWVSIPLPIEYRAFYGMGELAVSVMSGREHKTSGEIASELMGQISQMLPLDFAEGGGRWTNVVPSFAKPAVEAYNNTSWTGLPIQRQDTQWNENDPQYTKAFRNANKYIVGTAEWLNSITGGNEHKQGTIDISPAKIEYMLSGYFGGMFNVIDKLAKTGETLIGQRDFDTRSILLLNRVLKEGNESTQARAVNNDFFKVQKEIDDQKKLIKDYVKDTATGKKDYSKELDEEAYSPKYLRSQIYEEYSSLINDLTTARNALPKDDEQREDIDKDIVNVKKDMLSEMRETYKLKEEDIRKMYQENGTAYSPLNWRYDVIDYEHGQTSKKIKEFQKTKNKEGYDALVNSNEGARYQALGSYIGNINKYNNKIRAAEKDIKQWEKMPDLTPEQQAMIEQRKQQIEDAKANVRWAKDQATWIGEQVKTQEDLKKFREEYDKLRQGLRQGETVDVRDIDIRKAKDKEEGE